MSLQERVASRYIQATDEAAFDALVDHWTDQFLDEVAAHTKIDEPAVESFLASKGVDADDLVVTDPFAGKQPLADGQRVTTTEVTVEAQ